MVYHRHILGRVIRKRSKDTDYEKMMKTLLLQNQQIIIQQQNMMFMVLKQLQHNTHPSPQHNQSSPLQESSPINSIHLDDQAHQQQQQHQHQHQHQHHNHQQQHHHHNNNHNHQHNHPIQQSHSETNHQQHHQAQANNNLGSQQTSNTDPNIIQMTVNQQLQQVTNNMQENSTLYLTPVASEETPLSDDKSEEHDLVAFLENDGPLQNDIFYNPQTEIGQVTPYKSHEQQQTPSYYSSNNSCTESLSTPRVEQQRQPITNNINQAVVKNLSEHFKSPTKPKINIQIMSGSNTGCMKNNKAKIIQSMNISAFLRNVHSENNDVSKSNAS